MIKAQVPLDGRHHPAEFFLAHLHGPPDERIRIALAPDRVDQVASAKDEASRLRAAKALPAGEDRKVGTEA